MTPIIKVAGIRKAFPGVVALQDGHLSVNPGEVHALVGENGAGKSTLVNVMCGAVQPDSGHMELMGRPFQPRRPTEAYNAGVRVAFQHLSLIPFMTVEENLYIGRERTAALGFIRRGAMKARVDALLGELGFGDIRPGDRVANLRTSQRFLIEVAKAVLEPPHILVMDEPTAALNDTETELLYAITRRLRDSGSGIVWITHRLDELYEITDRITIMRDGSWIDTQATRDLSHDEIIRRMTGREIEETRHHPDGETAGERRLAVRNLQAANGVHDLNLDLYAGEVVGVGGLAGSGVESIGKLLFGVEPFTAGSVEVLGHHYGPGQMKPGRMASQGIFYLPGDRTEEGIVAVRSVQENALISARGLLARLGFLNRRGERSAIHGYIDSLGIKTRSADQLIQHLSGGNQQKVLFARGMLTGADIFILEEPTQGVDVGAKADIYKVIHELAREGAAVLVISTDTRELLTISHRLLAVHDGEIVASFSAADATEDSLVSAYFGYSNQSEKRETA